MDTHSYAKIWHLQSKQGNIAKFWKVPGFLHWANMTDVWGQFDRQHVAGQIGRVQAYVYWASSFLACEGIFRISICFRPELEMKERLQKAKPSRL